MYTCRIMSSPDDCPATWHTPAKLFAPLFHNQYKNVSKILKVLKSFLNPENCPYFLWHGKNILFKKWLNFAWKISISYFKINTGILWFGPMRAGEIQPLTNERPVCGLTNENWFVWKPSRHVNFSIHSQFRACQRRSLFLLVLSLHTKTSLKMVDNVETTT